MMVCHKIFWKRELLMLSSLLQARQLICYLFDALSPESYHAIIPQSLNRSICGTFPKENPQSWYVYSDWFKLIFSFQSNCDVINVFPLSMSDLPFLWSLPDKEHFETFILSSETKSIHTFQMKNYFNSQDDKNNFVNFVNHCITAV